MFFRLFTAILATVIFTVRVSAADGFEHTRAPLQVDALSYRTVGNLAIAEGNVVLGNGETTIHCNHAQYDLSSSEILVSGDVRIYNFRGDRVFAGDQAIYNLNTKEVQGTAFRTAAGPFLIQAQKLVSAGSNAFEVSEGLFTTDNSANPGYHLRARKVRIFHNDHTEYENVTIYVGHTPVLWLPYLYQPAQTAQSFSIAPGSRSTWGPFLMTRFAFPLGQKLTAGARLDYYAKRGIGGGLDFTRQTPEQESNAWGRFRSYFVDDKKPGSKELGSSDERIDSRRYRVSVQDRSFLTETVYTSLNFNLLSDINFFRDFSPAEQQRDPNPDSVLSLTRLGENHALTLEPRKQFNSDFEGNDALPALTLQLKQTPLGATGLFYEGENSAGLYRRNFLNPTGPFAYLTYDTVRLDTFHQLSFPKLLGGWLAVVPKAGIRLTHYSDSVSDLSVQNRSLPGSPAYDAHGGDLFRHTVNAGLETSFKLSRTFDSVENRTWGLDGLRHIFQPFSNWSWVGASRDPAHILPIDVLNGTAKLPAIDFPQFNSLDSLTDWHVVRMGVRNRLQTRRNNETLNWLELESFVDARIEAPRYSNSAFGAADPGGFSNVFNRLHWNPLPWMDLQVDSQLPVFDRGYSELNSSSNLQVSRDLTFLLGNRYISGNSYFNDSHLINGGARLRMNDNWSFSFEENYETTTGQLEFQRYTLDRDLRSWVASFSLVIRERDTKNDIAVLLTLSLKDLPKFRVPLHFDPESAANASNSKNR